MKTQINQIFTIVSFFTMSLTTTLVISWGMSGLLVEEQEICPTESSTIIHVIKEKVSGNYSFKFNNSMKLLVPKITTKITSKLTR